MSDANRFLEALESLHAQSERDDTGVFRVRISLADLPGASKDPRHRDLVFELDAGRTTLTIHRPSARAPHVKGMHLIQEAVSYTWNGGVPAPPRYEPPRPVVTLLRKSTANRLYDAPIIAALRYAADKCGVYSECSDAIDRVGTRLWREVWHEIGQELEPEAATLAARYRFDWRKYRCLVERPDLRLLLERAPGIGPRFRELPQGMRLKDAIVELLGVTARRQNPHTGQSEYHQFGRAAAFQAWVRAVPWSDALVPLFKLPDAWIPHEPDDPRWELMKRIAQLAEEGHLDPNRIRQIQGEEEWLLFHTAVAQNAQLEVLAALLRNPAAAVRAVHRIASGEAYRGESLKRRMTDALWHINQWRTRARVASLESMVWAKRLQDPSVAFEDPAMRVNGFGRYAREIKRYQRRCDAIAKLGDLKNYTSRVTFLFFASHSVLRRIVGHPEFSWDDGQIYFFLADRRLRLDPLIRPILVERAIDPKAILTLLEDKNINDARILWKRLVEIRRDLALEYLETHGFIPGCGWKSEDLVPLLRGGGEWVVRTLPLLAKLPSESVDRESQPEQYDLFGTPSPATTTLRRRSR